jgi:cell wall-associated NlpC family hydrolase
VHRSTLTGIFVFAVSASLFGNAAADQVEPARAPLAVSAPAAVVSGADTAHASADETFAPSAGADLVTWNAAREAPPQADAKRDHTSRLRRFASGIVVRSATIATSLTRSAMRFIGTPYVFGGTRTSGFDCSGYVQHVFALLGMRLPRTADAQFDAGHHIAARMEPGDLVFFHTYAPGVSHVGIYLGHSRFIHSSSRRGVAISSLHNAYWAPRYLGAKRIFGS